ncbi:hypothetical protein ONZ51_g1938 [Trametes cubensis]|uniref:DUF6535 domain-containing protein n=1 Tax=Trametes cubensis TaxID=1111947 RepID=A0AAD7U306_9APHY|nr:hypothetical protein ONZ51_g1938 [Trametes cubensis]
MTMLRSSRHQSSYSNSGLPGTDEEINRDLEAGVDSNEAWQVCSNLLSAREGELVSAWADQADGLVTFAALFSAVVTSFVLETYKNLQVDNDTVIIGLLRQISAQLDGARPLPDVGPAAFQPLPSDVLQNSLLFASLICSLLAAGMGIFYKEWIRQYTLRTPSDPKLLMRVRQHRYLGLCRWKLGAIIGGISIFLQLGVAFFIGALLLFVYNLNAILRLVLSTFVTIWAVFWVGTAVITVGSYLSRLSLYTRTHAKHADSLHSTLEDWELDAVEQPKCKVRLDAGALCYLLRAYTGDKRAIYVERCIQDLSDEEAGELFQELKRTRPGPPNHTTTEDVGNDDPAIQRLKQLKPNMPVSPFSKNC